MERIVWLFPILFIFHDMEEIIGLKLFLQKRSQLLETKCPKNFDRYKNFSTEGFALAVLEELIICIILSGLVIICSSNELAYIWFGAFIGFAIHLLVHIVQWLLLKVYIPAVITSVICLPASIYLIVYCIKFVLLFTKASIAFTLLGVVIVIINLVFAQRLMCWYAEKTEH